ncbi:nickel ABC transporter permease [candidate division KSB3 bacterium]|uniref:Nickel ABC transporter permease n=1 Tax=candidate division KSB3 bacterium TaxID=2044937 RepID=A0A2G6E1L2_9BACT|nr:MAG: nickel ABC transporter permease [candidate division KSB3 bacterium]
MKVKDVLAHQAGLEIAKVISRRLGQMILTLLGASVIIWSLLPLAPGDPAYRILVAQGVSDPTELEVDAKRRELGLDRPYVLQYVQWVSRVIRGDFSESFQNGKPVIQELGKRLPATWKLASLALVMAALFSIVLSLLCTAFHNSWIDRIILFCTQIGASTPSFLIGILALQFIIVEMGLGKVLSQGNTALIMLPALCLSISRSSSWTQLLRAGMLEAVGSQYALVATARGANKIRVLFKYVLPNALLPFLTVVGLGVGGLIGGSAIIEAIFTWPGIGSFVFTAIVARDYPVVQGFVIIAGASYVIASTMVDLIGLLLDPRIREGGRV